LLRHMGIIAAATPTKITHGLISRGKVLLDHMGACKFNAVNEADGGLLTIGFLSQVTGNIRATCCGSTQNQHGFVGGNGGSMVLISCAASHSRMNGYWWDDGIGNFRGYSRDTNWGIDVSGWSYSGGNGTNGIQLSSNSSISLSAVPNGEFVTKVLVQQNDQWGLQIYLRGMIVVAGSSRLQIEGSGKTQVDHYDVYASLYGYLQHVVNVYGSRIFNVPIGTLSSTGALIA
jgi:hypothetical protein